MVRISYTDIDEDCIVSRNPFVVNEILPLILRLNDNNVAEILYIASQNSTESSIYLSQLFKYNKEEKDILMTHPLNIENIKKNPDKLKIYREFIAELGESNNYITSFDLKECEEHKMFYSCTAMRQFSNSSKYCDVIDLMFPRENYLKMNLFFYDLNTYTFESEKIFLDPTLNKMKFETMNHIKLDSVSSDSNLIYAHYSCGCGPAYYKFTFIFPRTRNTDRIRNHIPMYTFESFYKNDPIVILNDIVYDQNKDALYVIHRKLNPINDKDIVTTGLIMPKDIYDHSNLLDIEKIYLEDLKNEETEEK